MKDPRFYILPLISVIIVAVFLVNPGITGLIIGTGGGAEENLMQLSGKVSITISKEIIPEDAVVTVFLSDQSSAMPIKDFIEKTGKEYEFKYGRISEIGYEGYGYGKGTYTLDLSDFGLNLMVEPGNYTLTTEISYENFVISSTSQDVVV